MILVDFQDADGETIPSQDLYLVTLANGYSFAARGSGTEPKMKFYLFAQEPVKSAAEPKEYSTQLQMDVSVYCHQRANEGSENQ